MIKVLGNIRKGSAVLCRFQEMPSVSTWKNPVLAPREREFSLTCLGGRDVGVGVRREGEE